MRIRVIAIPATVAGAVVLLVGWAVSDPIRRDAVPQAASVPDDLDPVVREIDGWFVNRWQSEFAWRDENGKQVTGTLEAAPPAAPLTVLRRLSLALHGTVPSLEEIRAFEADEGPHRLRRWTQRLLADQRFADYFAERLARSLVGVDAG